MQLLFVGSQGLYIVGNPEMTYFKAVYKRHTSFSTESIRVPFSNKPVLTYSTRTLVTAPIGRNGDLVKDMFLAFTLPNIYSTDEFRFQWIPKIGNYIINNYSLLVGGQRIDRRYGEWLDIWNELSLPTDKADMYHKMIGHTKELYEPRSKDPVYNVTNNNLVFLYYPVGEEGNPSIPTKKLFVPLQFFFTKNPALAIPLLCLAYNEVVVEIEFNPLKDLYQVYDADANLYVSPEQLRSDRGKSAVFGKFLTPDIFNPLPNALDIDAYLEVNYVFLDEQERKRMAEIPHDFLIEQVIRYEKDGMLENNTFDLVMNYPVKEFVWLTRRSDMFKYNNWGNLTNSILEDDTEEILKTAKFIFNGMDRIEEKDAAYFHLMQPYMHHTRSPKSGIYCYSFSLYPERSVQPSGFVNCSLINRIQMVASMNPVKSIGYDYTLVLYSLSYNIFRVMGGMGGVVFSM